MTRIVFIAVAILAFWACNTTEPPPPPTPPNLTLEALDASSTEVWLQVTLRAGIQPRTIIVQRDSITVLNATLTGSDTLIVDEQLEPNRQYTYSLMRPTGHISERATSTITTLDTTSHNFTWDLAYLGEGSSSTFYDVAIINDSLVYAVGEVYSLDSNGQVQNPPYNLAKWNGLTWELMTLRFNCRLYYPNCGPETLLYAPARSVFAFGPNDVWVSAGSIHHFDGVRWTQEAGLQGAGDATKIWGASGDLWFVGYNGFVGYRSASGSWQQIESGTTLDMQDVWGEVDSRTNVPSVLCIASNRATNQGMRVLKIEDNSVAVLPDIGLPWSLRTIWFTGRTYFVLGDGAYRSTYPISAWSQISSFPALYKYRIRGTGINDIAVVGAFGLISHFNGYSWKHYTGQEVPNLNGTYYSVSIKGNTIMAVGAEGSRAIVLKGTRP